MMMYINKLVNTNELISYTEPFIHHLSEEGGQPEVAIATEKFPNLWWNPYLKTPDPEDVD